MMAWSPCLVSDSFFFTPLQNQDQPSEQRGCAMEHTALFVDKTQDSTFLVLVFLLYTRQRAAENGSHVTVSSAGGSLSSRLIDEISR